MSLIDYNNIDIYQEDNLVLKDVNFQVEEGEFIYIIGKVGSGKTSLLKTLYCELDLYKDAEKDEQKAEVLGRDMLTLKPCAESLALSFKILNCYTQKVYEKTLSSS